MSKHRTSLVLIVVMLLSTLWIASAHAQVQDGAWSQPFRLSSEGVAASEGYCVADQFGFVHCFWTETLAAEQLALIQYARFDGEVWTTPNEIYVTRAFSGIKNVSPVVDQYGILHIAWAEGLNGPAYYTRAPANNAQSARSWPPPVRIDVPARQLHLRVDSAGIFHIVYTDQMEEPGVFYIRSEDQGTSWSEPAWLDPDILPNHVPDKLNFELDDAGGLHAVWYYAVLDQTYAPDWVRYAHSLDGGATWSSPFLIDHVVEETDYNLNTAGPIMAVQGQTVHVIWAAGDLPYRHHRYSTDAGQTWSAPRHIFGELHGQAFDGFAVDGAGRVHFIGHIRYPMAIYHAYWDQTRWTSPSLIYLIEQEGKEFVDIIPAHNTSPIVRAGNQLVLTFADNPSYPNRRLFAMHRILDDVPPLAAVPTPTPIPAPSPTPLPPTPMLTLTATAPPFDAANSQPLERVPGWDLALQVAIIPTLLLLAGAVVFQWWHRYKP